MTNIEVDFSEERKEFTHAVESKCNARIQKTKAIFVLRNKVNGAFSSFLFYHPQPLCVAGEFAGNDLRVGFPQELGRLPFLSFIKYNAVYFPDAVHFYCGAGKERFIEET